MRVEYFLTPKASGPYAPLAAAVTYKAEADAKTQVRLFVVATMFEVQLAKGISLCGLLTLLQVAYGATPSLYILSPTQKLMRTALYVVRHTPLPDRLGIRQHIAATHVHGSRALTMHSPCAGQLPVSWHGSHSRAVVVGWIHCGRRCSLARWLLGLHSSNRCKQAEKVQAGSRRSHKNVVAAADMVVTTLQTHSVKLLLLITHACIKVSLLSATQVIAHKCHQLSLHTDILS